MNLLFVCSENKLRSPTAATVFSGYEGISAISAGTNADADTPLSGDLIEWADVIFVMEKSHRKKVSTKFSSLLRHKKLICLDIADNYRYMQAELVQLLKRRVQSSVAIDIDADAGENDINRF